MPHIVVKMYKGRTQEQKRAMAEEILKALKKTVDAPESHTSISIEEYDPRDWPRVESAEIDGKPESLYMRAGRLVK